ncbi:MAG: DNA repair protein RecO [Tissierellia bacterium]|nr:DNA repair protein RecO [Tissierellia bacterium]
MRQYELEGVVLKRNKINDSDCYLSIFTRQRGRVEVFARGANHPKNALNIGSSPFSYGLYQVSGNKLQLRSVMVLDSFYDLRKDFSVMLMASFFSRSYIYLFQENQTSVAAFELLVNSLSVLKKYPMFMDKLLVYFLANLIEILGIMPDLDCVNLEGPGYQLLVETGEVVEGGSEAEVLVLWREANRLKMSTFLNLNLDDELVKRAPGLMEQFIYTHLGANIPALHKEMEEYL